ncbi:hypothetical protein [Methanogenium cariaci]|uniref:hypothetical protein n=1 Tax=Methanogenium cariaci TaxID=2197 RepID=UPI001FDEF98D|nr:hypothetical protein [Methanogenium cariaci]
MTFPVVWIYWAVSLTIVTYAAAWMLNNKREYGYAALVAIYAVYLADPRSSLHGWWSLISAFMYFSHRRRCSSTRSYLRPLI